MGKFKNIPLAVSLLILTLYPLLTYFTFIPFLGFYNDDWLFAYIGHFYGIQGLIGGFAGDRPLVGILFALNHLLLNNNILLWHVYMFLMRLLGGYVLFFLLRKLWPDKLSTITSITLLFLTYPGFLQQTVPLGYQNYITALTVWVVSLFFTIHAITNRSKILFALFTLIALILQIISFSLVEIFIGAEIFRLLLIFHKKLNYIELKKKLKLWSPYIISLILFVLWRIFIFKSARETTNISWVSETYYSDPFWIAKIPLKVIYSFLSAVIFSYFIPIVVRLTRIPLENSILSISIGIISSTVLYFYFKFVSIYQYNKDLSNKNDNKRLGKILFFIGIISIFAALVPVILSGRYVSELSNNDNYDRFTISIIVAVGFIITGLLLYKAQCALRQWFMILLIAISVTTHLMNSYWHVIYWNQQKNIWWQLYWRTPQIKRETLLIFDFPKTIDNTPFKNTVPNIYKTFRLEDYQIWAPGNLFFNYLNSPQNHFSGQYLISKGSTQKIRDKIVESIPQESSTFRYINNFNNTIIVSLPGDNSCLWALDKTRKELPDNSSELAKNNLSYSNIDQLVQKGALPSIPPTRIFGHEPPKNWCYYFQKASLYRQLNDWNKLSELKDEVIQKGLNPKDPNEWLPFIEGLIVNEKYDEVKYLIQKASKEKSGMFTNNVCKMIQRLKVTDLLKTCK